MYILLLALLRLRTFFFVPQFFWRDHSPQMGWEDHPLQLFLIHQSLIAYFNTLRLRQNGRHFADDIFKCIFLNENVWIPIKISLKFAPKGPIKNIQALVQIMAWRRPGDKPLSESMLVSLPTHTCVTRPQWALTCISWGHSPHFVGGTRLQCIDCLVWYILVWAAEGI